MRSRSSRGEPSSIARVTVKVQPGQDWMTSTGSLAPPWAAEVAAGAWPPTPGEAPPAVPAPCVAPWSSPAWKQGQPHMRVGGKGVSMAGEKNRREMQAALCCLVALRCGARAVEVLAW